MKGREWLLLVLLVGAFACMFAHETGWAIFFGCFSVPVGLVNWAYNRKEDREAYNKRVAEWEAQEEQRKKDDIELWKWEQEQKQRNQGR